MIRHPLNEDEIMAVFDFLKKNAMSIPENIRSNPNFNLCGARLCTMFDIDAVDDPTILNYYVTIRYDSEMDSYCYYARKIYEDFCFIGYHEDFVKRGKSARKLK